MQRKINDRVLEAAHLLIKKRTNIREIAKELGYSKSTIHIDLSVRLKELNIELYHKIMEIFQINQSEKHIRGGLSTKRKYLK